MAQFCATKDISKEYHLPAAMQTLYDKISLDIAHITERTDLKAGAWTTLGVVITPLAINTWCVCTTRVALYAPLALPWSLRNTVQWRIKTVYVVADVTFVTEDQTAFIVRLATAFAHRAVKTPPSLLQHCHGHLQQLTKQTITSLTISFIIIRSSLVFLITTEEYLVKCTKERRCCTALHVLTQTGWDQGFHWTWYSSKLSV